jgi:hypothetical protein
MRRRIAAVGIPRLAAPVLSVIGRRVVVPFPPDRPIRSERDVGKNGIFLDHRHCVGVRLRPGPWGDAEEARLRIDRPKPAVGADPQPRDIIAEGMNFPAFHTRRRYQHGEISFSAGAGERAANIVDFAVRALHADDHHMFGKPTFALAELAGDA